MARLASTFSAETKQRDDDTHMLQYIENEMEKRLPQKEDTSEQESTYVNQYFRAVQMYKTVSFAIFSFGLSFDVILLYMYTGTKLRSSHCTSSQRESTSSQSPRQRICCPIKCSRVYQRLTSD